MSVPVGRLVIVDDDANLAAELRLTLEDVGFDVVGVGGNGREGVDLVTALAPDVAIFDVRMPVMGGAEAAAILCRQGVATRVVLLSAYDDDGIRAEATACGVVGYVVKGAPLRELISIISPLCAGSAG